MDLEKLKSELEILLQEVNQVIKVDSPLFFQKSYEFTEVVSRAGKLWARCKANFEGTKVDFEIWEADTELNIRKYLEDLGSVKSSMAPNSKPERITEARVVALVRTDKEYRGKRLELIEAEELLNMAEKGIFEAGKLRGFISQAIIRRREDVK